MNVWRGSGSAPSKGELRTMEKITEQSKAEALLEVWAQALALGEQEASELVKSILAVAGEVA